MNKPIKNTETSARNSTNDDKSQDIRISTHREYQKIMARVDALIEIPDANLTNEQASELQLLASSVQEYEKTIFNIKPPTTFYGLLELKMFELKINKGEMAKKLKISNAKFSMILKGKQKPDIPLLKAVQQNLGIDGNYLLSVL